MHICEDWIGWDLQLLPASRHIAQRTVLSFMDSGQWTFAASEKDILKSCLHCSSLSYMHETPFCKFSWMTPAFYMDTESITVCAGSNAYSRMWCLRLSKKSMPVINRQHFQLRWLKSFWVNESVVDRLYTKILS